MTTDYPAAISTAALFDTSAAGKLVLTGPDAPMFLGNLCTNDTKNLPLGGGCEAYFCDSRAKVQFAAWIYHVTPRRRPARDVGRNHRRPQRGTRASTSTATSSPSKSRSPT